MFARLAAERRTDPGALDAWFGSHPFEESRIARTTTLISTIGPSVLGPLVAGDPSFAAFKEVVRGLGASR